MHSHVAIGGFHISDVHSIVMQLLFSYGSLQRDRVQLSVFARRLTGVVDRLPGYRAIQVPIGDPQRTAFHNATYYTNVVPADTATDHVPGTVLELTDQELVLVDEFERLDGYGRIQVRMASGRLAWLFVSGSRDANLLSPV